MSLSENYKKLLIRYANLEKASENLKKAMTKMVNQKDFKIKELNAVNEALTKAMYHMAFLCLEKGKVVEFNPYELEEDPKDIEVMIHTEESGKIDRIKLQLRKRIPES